MWNEIELSESSTRNNIEEEKRARVLDYIHANYSGEESDYYGNQGAALFGMMALGDEEALRRGSIAPIIRYAIDYAEIYPEKLPRLLKICYEERGVPRINKSGDIYEYNLPAFEKLIGMGHRALNVFFDVHFNYCLCGDYSADILDTLELFQELTLMFSEDEPALALDIMINCMLKFYMPIFDDSEDEEIKEAEEALSSQIIELLTACSQDDLISIKDTLSTGKFLRFLLGLVSKDLSSDRLESICFLFKFNDINLDLSDLSLLQSAPIAERKSLIDTMLLSVFEYKLRVATANFILSCQLDVHGDVVEYIMRLAIEELAESFGFVFEDQDGKTEIEEQAAVMQNCITRRPPDGQEFLDSFKCCLFSKTRLSILELTPLGRNLKI